MKRGISLVLALMMCLSLCACGKSKAAKECENLINVIGEISIDSKGAIEAAEKAYAALTSDEKDSISESAVALEDARSAYIFELSKAAYQNINSSYEITQALGSDLYNGLYVVIHGSDAVKGNNVIENLSEECLNLSEDDIKAGLSYALAKYKYGKSWDELSNEEKETYIKVAEGYAFDDESIGENRLFIACWTIIHAYELNGKLDNAKNDLESAKVLMLELSEKYSDYKHYPNLKGYYTTSSSYLDAIENFKMSFEAFKELKQEYEKEARDYINDLDFIFGE